MLSNKTLETIGITFAAIILLFSFYKAYQYKSGDHPDYKEPPGDELCEDDFINQDNPHYFE